MKNSQTAATEAFLDGDGLYRGGAGASGGRGSGRVYAGGGKRVLDIFIVLFTLPFTVPVILICAALVALDGRWPFFGHKRVGMNGREFRCWKVRSMAAGAQERLQAYLDANPEARAEWEKTRKLKHDPRITRIGHFLRKSSLDELPQVFNVLKGEMSIVGPRPVVKDELALYGRDAHAYLAMRPGITGLWQVSGRNEVDYEARVAFDKTYRDSCSLARDVSIILRTFRVVVVRNGH
ncbi:sugar transferase [Rhodobacter sp. ETT8]|uniref:Sugar transferase n=2 Tax=Pseudotabrizicola algicola TaxID=2709381 RepID=A0A6B3RTG2_9RHOB|nr:sugar transferase [Pseudotabrizicola algicola]NEX48831.1 sugar transferase [Pseudotabrizicola algicola]